jgi:hypothetical protein
VKIPALLAKTQAPAREWCIVIGLIISAHKYVSLGRLHVRRLQLSLNKQWKVRTDLAFPIILTEECRVQLNWWLNKSNVMTGVSSIPFTPTIHLFTGASLKGWGAHVNETRLSGLWSTDEAKLYINLLEMKAVKLAVRQCPHLLANQNILLSTDNSTVVAYINKQGWTHSRFLFLLVEDLLLYVNELGSSVKAKHIPGVRNVLADQLSHRVLT